jgi:polar amino acid transport system substrate-binding protein
VAVKISFYKIYFYILSALISLAVTVSCPAFGIAQDKIRQLRIATFQNSFPPLVWYEEKNGTFEALGIEPDILEELSRRTGIKYELFRMPFKRIKASLEFGCIDASLGGWKWPDREVYGTYMDRPMAYDFFRLYVIRGREFNFDKVEDLFDKKIGKLHAVNVYPEMDNAIKEGKMEVLEVNKRNRLIKMLELGRLDAMLSSSIATTHELSVLGITNVVALPKMLTKPQGTYIWFSKKSAIDPSIIERFNQAMEDMHQDGTIERILQKYGIKSNGYIQ